MSNAWKAVTPDEFISEIERLRAENERMSRQLIAREREAVNHQVMLDAAAEIERLRDMNERLNAENEDLFQKRQSNWDAAARSMRERATFSGGLAAAAWASTSPDEVKAAVERAIIALPLIEDQIGDDA